MATDSQYHLIKCLVILVIRRNEMNINDKYIDELGLEVKND